MDVAKGIRNPQLQAVGARDFLRSHRLDAQTVLFKRAVERMLRSEGIQQIFDDALCAPGDCDTRPPRLGM
jgi:hypothetical protein